MQTDPEKDFALMNDFFLRTLAETAGGKFKDLGIGAKVLEQAARVARDAWPRFELSLPAIYTADGIAAFLLLAQDSRRDPDSYAEQYKLALRDTLRVVYDTEQSYQEYSDPAEYTPRNAVRDAKVGQLMRENTA